MALTLAQIRARDEARREAFSIPGAPPDGADGLWPGPVFLSAEQPTDIPVGTLWIPLNLDGSPKSIDNWQVYS